MLGGLSRRASYLRSLTPPAALVRVENGDLTEAMGRQDELKAETAIEMLNSLDYEAVNLGEKDFRLGLPYLASLQARFKGALLCANVRRAEGTALFQEYTAIRRMAGDHGVRIVIVGLLSDQFADAVQALDPDLRVESPAARLERLEPELAARGELRVLLFHGPKAEAAALGRQFKGFQLVVYGHEADHAEELAQGGETVLACSGQDGKYLGRAMLTEDAGWRVAEVRYPALGPELTEDAAVVRSDRAYLERVAAEQLLEKVPRVPTLNGDAFAGTSACAPCHPAAHAVWRGSAHATAMATLVAEQHDRDPECVGCHVVGLDRVGGFVSRQKTPQLQDVGCESCHGAAAKHARDPKVALPKAGTEACGSCHVPEHSPNFAFDAYWQKIRH
jgi:hypothetical protein